MKQNDWLVASLNNPNFTPQDFKDVSGMTLDNTQFLSKDDYKKSSFVRNQKVFQDNDGKFSEDKFDSYYNNIASTFNVFSTEDEVDNYQYSIWDINRPSEGKIKDINFNISSVSNPEHLRIGIEGINKVTTSDKSRRELAQNSKIYDPATGTYLDKSVNDVSLFSNPLGYILSLFEEPLVYATYDEDTVEIDPVTGNKVKHLKGEWKVNDEGEYYIEKANGRNLRDKQVVSVEDYLTSENSALNKYDFMDSDDLEKSVAGTVAKNVAAVIPMLIPGINTAYSGLLVGRELAKSLPMAYGMMASLTGDDVVDNQLANTIAAYGQKFTGSTSDYAQEKTFSFENFGNLMSDVALQWGQQKFIANTYNKLKSGSKDSLVAAEINAQKDYTDKATQYIIDAGQGKISAAQLNSYVGITQPGEILEAIQSGKWANTALGKAALNKYLPAVEKTIQNRNRIAQDLSLVYMAIVSNTDVYDSILQKGGTPEEAAALAFGSTLGMFGVDRYLGLGEMFFQKDEAKLALRQAARENAELYMAGKKAVVDTSTKKGIVGAIQKGVDLGKKTVDSFSTKYKDGTLGLVGKAIGEGTEEMAEELVTDFTKTLGELAGKLGYFSQTDYGAWENAGERYTMSFLGGFAGGAMFGGVEAWNNRNNSTRQFQNEITYLLRQGKKGEILSELKKLQKTGKLGSTNLSYDSITNSDGTTTQLTANEDHKSQAQANYEGLSNIINQLDFIINDNQLNLSEDELFDKMVQGEYRADSLSDYLKGEDLETTKNISYISRFQEDFQNLSNQIINIEQQINEKINSTTDEEKRKNPKYKEDLEKLQQQKQELLKEKDYLFGEGSLGYLEKTLFAMDTKLSGNFLALNLNQFARDITGKSLSQLTSAELETVQDLFKKSQNNAKDNLDKGFRLYKQMEVELTPELSGLKNIDLNTVKKIREADPANKLLKETDKLDSETDEEYESLKEPREGESQEDYNKRVQAHKDAVRKYNLDNQFNWIQEFAKTPITTTDFRYFVSKVEALRNELVKYYLENTTVKQADGSTKPFWQMSVISWNGEPRPEDVADVETLNSDIYDLITRLGVQNVDTLKKALKDRIRETAEQIVLRVLPRFDTITQDDMVTSVLNEITLLSKEEKEARGIPVDYKYNDDGVITYKDLAVYIKYSNKKLNEIWEDFEFVGITKDDLDPFQKFLAEVSINPDLLQEEVANTIFDVSSSKEQELTEDLTNQVTEKFFKNIDSFVKALNESKQLKTLNALEKATFVKNPIIPLINKISSFTKKETNVETLLQEIYETYHNQEKDSDFQLTDSQLANLKQVLQDFKVAQAFLYGASVSSDSTYPVGHNKTLNDFINNHKDIFPNAQELVEISSEDFNMLLGEIATYSREINSWIAKHDTNTAQREVRFIKTDEALVKTINQFFKLNRNAFKISPTLDLLDGYEAQTLDDSLNTIIALQEILYNNFLKSGLNIDEVLDKLSPVIFDKESALSQDNIVLDENLTYKDFSAYAKFQLIVSSCAASSIQYYQNLRAFLEANNNLAPVSSQEFPSKLVYAQQANTQLVNKALEWLAKDSKLDVAYNTTISTGVGGSGKTFAVARLNVGTGKDSWLSGPTQSQVDNLNKSLPEGEGKTKQDLLSIIFGGTVPSDYWTVSQEDGLACVKLKNNLSIQKINNTPKNIIIDEITHFSTPELLAISKFCETNNIHLIVLGDTHQNGYFDKDNVGNIENNSLIAWRTPPMYLSLRNGNAIKVANQSPLINMIDKLAVEEPSIYGRTIYDDIFKSFRLKYYNKETFNGDLITDSIDDDLLNKIPKDATIGFIGDNTSPEYKKLVDAGFKVSDPIAPLDVQGREFDYVVVDKKWALDPIGDNWSLNYYNIQNFNKDFYTMITRSTQGTILIDNGLSNIIGKSVEVESNGVYSGIEKSIENFRKKRIPEIDKALEDTKDLLLQQKPKKESESQEKIVVGGTEITNEELNEEKDSVKIGDNTNEIEGSNNDELGTITDTPLNISAYSNVSYSGINTVNKEWVNDTNSYSDLGIFIKPGETVTENKVDLMIKVLTLKSAIIYGSSYIELPNYITQLFDEDAFKNIEYYIKIEDISDSNRLIGLTKGLGLENEKRGIQNKVIKVVAKLKARDGKIYSISLGGLNNPETWKQNAPKIKAAIKARIDNGDPNSESLQKEYDSYDDNITKYETKVSEWIKKNQEFRINPPKFSSYTRLQPLKASYRLEDSVSDDAIYKSYVPLQVESAVHIVLGDMPGVDKSLIGKPVMFVSSNFLLKPSQLKDVYVQQSQNPNMSKQVRMVVLDNIGVSFKSLYQKKWQELYNITAGNLKFTTPMELQPFAIRMYKAMWNYRAGLARFLERYESFLKENNLNDEDIIKLCQDDNSEYNKLKVNKVEFSEAEYRKSVDSEKAEVLSVLWKFNDSLSDYVKEFRLGYSSDHGVYLRKLTNINTKFYDNPNNVVGIYINPQIARDQYELVNKLFENIVNKIIPSENTNLKSYITNTTNLEKGWFDKVVKQKEIKLEFIDENNSTKSSLHLDNVSQLTTLPLIIIKAAKYLNVANHVGSQDYIDFLHQQSEDGHKPFSIKYQDEELNWFDVLSSLDNQVGTDPENDYIEGVPGILPYDSESNIGTLDSRLDDFWNLMFHGTVSTPVENDFTRDFIRATSAQFKYGIFSDPIVAYNKKGSKENVDVTLTSRKLFRVNAAAAGTILQVDISPYKETKSKTKPQEVRTDLLEDPIQQTASIINPILSKLGITIKAANFRSLDNYINKVNVKIKSVLEDFIKGNTSNNFEDLILKIDNEGNVDYLKDKVEFKGKTLKSIEVIPEGKALTFTDSEGKEHIYHIWYSDGEIDIKEMNKDIIHEQNMTPEQVVTTISNLIEPFFKSIEDGEEEFKDIIKKVAERSKGDISWDTFTKIINNVVFTEDFKNIYRDEHGFDELEKNIKNFLNSCPI